MENEYRTLLKFRNIALLVAVICFINSAGYHGDGMSEERNVSFLLGFNS